VVRARAVAEKSGNLGNIGGKCGQMQPWRSGGAAIEQFGSGSAPVAAVKWRWLKRPQGWFRAIGTQGSSGGVISTGPDAGSRPFIEMSA